MSACILVELSLVVTLRPRDPSENVYNTAGFRGSHYSLVILPVTMLRNGWTFAEAVRGPVPVPRSGGGIAGLTPIPPYGKAFPPLAPPPTPTPAPTATVSVIAPDGVRVVSLCQWHISISIFFVLIFLENANTYIIIVNYMNTTLVRSFVRSFVLVVGSPTTTTFTTTIAGRFRVPAARPSRGETRGNAICRAVVAFGRRPRRTTHWGPSW